MATSKFERLLILFQTTETGEILFEMKLPVPISGTKTGVLAGDAELKKKTPPNFGNVDDKIKVVQAVSDFTFK